MTEINQWTPMIQPVRAHTSAAVEQQDRTHNVSSMDANIAKSKLRPKISSYFGSHGESDRQVKPEVSLDGISQVRSQCADVEGLQLPRPDNFVESIMSKLVSSPHEGLGVHMNGPLLQICEAYRHLIDREIHLQRRLDSQLESHRSTVIKMQQIQNRWNEERQDYRTEVKRLELLLAKGTRGVAEVTLARKDSLLWQRKRKYKPPENKATADDGLQTIFEVLERARHGQDQAYNSQRATFRSRTASPSAHMRCISQHLVAKKSMTNVHTDLPFGSPPDGRSSTLTEATLLEAQDIPSKETEQHTHDFDPYECEHSIGLSDDTFSAFSNVSELGFETNPIDSQEECAMQDADDLAALRHVASMLVYRHDLDPASMIQKLVHMMDMISEDGIKHKYIAAELITALSRGNNAFSSDMEHASASTPKSCCSFTSMLPSIAPSMSHALEIPITRAGTLTTRKVTEYFQGNPSILAKASGFFQRLKPLLHGETSAPQGFQQRKFSFEVGDDDMVLSARSNDSIVMPKSQGLRKSVSLLSVSTRSYGTMLAPSDLPPKQTSTSSEPVPYASGVLTYCLNPRTQEVGPTRENSRTHLLTTIKHDENRPHKRGSRSRSSGGSHCVPRQRCAVTRSQADLEPHLLGKLKFANSSRSLLEHPEALRGRLASAMSSPATTVASHASPAAAKSAISHRSLYLTDDEAPCTSRVRLQQ